MVVRGLIRYSGVASTNHQALDGSGGTAEDTPDMVAENVSRDPPKWKLRYFAWAIALVLAIGSVLMPQFHSLALAAAFVFALGTVLPRCFYWPFLALEQLLRAILPASLANNLSFFDSPQRPPRRRRKLRRLERNPDMP
jgi:hypothetical protein